MLENGGDDIQDEGATWGVYTATAGFEQVRAALEVEGVAMMEANISMIPSNTTKLDGKKLRSMLKLLDGFEDQDDVQNVWSNMDFDEADLED